MLQRYLVLLSVVLIAFVINSCGEDPTSGSNVPNAITGKARLIDGDTEKPLDDHSGVQVSLKGTTFSTTTNAAGEYTFTGVPPGIYVITFAKPDFDSTTTRVEYSGVGVEFADEVTLSSKLKIHRVQGLVNLLMYGDTLTDLSGTIVQIIGTSLTTTTDINGMYSFANVPMGYHDVQATRTGFDTAIRPISYTGKGVYEVPALYLSAKSYLSITALFKYGQEPESHLFVYSDSVTVDKIWVGGTALPRSANYLIAIGGSRDVPYNAIEFELSDNDVKTADPVIPALASMEREQYIKYYSYDAIQAILNGELAGRTVRGRMKGFASGLNMVIHSNQKEIP